VTNASFPSRRNRSRIPIACDSFVSQRECQRLPG
jgi:hypothetical protein